MKITKVKNIRAAVGKTDGTPKGILYKHPGNGQGIKAHIDNRSLEAEKLYKVFNKPQKKDSMSEEDKIVFEAIQRIVDIVNDAMENTFRNAAACRDYIQREYEQKDDKNNNTIVITEEHIDLAILD